MSKVLRKCLLVLMAVTFAACGTTNPEQEDLNSNVDLNEFDASGIQVDGSTFSRLDGSAVSWAVKRDGFVSSPSDSSNFYFRIKLGAPGEDEGLTLYAYTSKDLSLGYGVHFFLDSHGPDEVNLVAEFIVNGRAEGGHHHVIEDLAADQRAFLLSIDIHPTEPHILIMDASNGSPKDHVLFDSENAMNLPKARLSTRWGVKIDGSNASITVPLIGAAVAGH